MENSSIVSQVLSESAQPSVTPQEQPAQQFERGSRGHFSQLAEQYISEEGDSGNENPSPENPSPENPLGETENPTQQDPMITRALTMIAKKERALLERERQIREKEEQLSSNTEDREYQEYKKLKEFAQDDPFSIIDHFGLSIEELNEKYANAGGSPSRRELELKKEIEEIKQWKKEREEREQKEKEEAEINSKRSDTQKRIREYVDNIKSIAEKEVDEDGNLKYELIKGEDKYELVFNVVNEYYRQNGKVLPEQAAMDLVEKHLENKMKNMLGYKKLGKYGQPKSENPDENDLFGEINRNRPNQNQINPTTLNNKDFAPSNPVSNSDRPLTKEERLRKAAELIQFE